MRRPSPPISLVLPVVLVITSVMLAAQENYRYPEITTLSSGNPLFRQYQDDVSAARMAIAAGKTPELHLYRYRAGTDENLLGIAARCSVPYDALASLNRIESRDVSIAGRMLLLPSIPALYLPERGNNRLEQLLLSSFDPDISGIFSFTLHEADGSSRTVFCLPDSGFDGTVRAFFLTPTFRFPLPEGMVTSTFGMRKNPITGNMVFHKGVDLAAPYGTPVLACADGTAISTGYNAIHGYYIILRHEGNRESLYGHLSERKIELHDMVKSGTIIGNVGSTGQSTGPHLHFEIHENGVPKNPAGFIQRN
ncbi:MAG TPA: peptidoglycan DD-metalloendopeptidase family protein [Treponemataceae bacterium]|nr:peptidoglycan DD-metalloendopeptidase family protein [Treponemataceae bacterium]